MSKFAILLVLLFAGCQSMRYSAIVVDKKCDAGHWAKKVILNHPRDVWIDDQFFVKVRNKYEERWMHVSRDRYNLAEKGCRID